MAREGELLLQNSTDGSVPTAASRSTVAPGWKTTTLAVYYSLAVCLGGLQFGFVIVFSSPILDDFQGRLPVNFTVWSGFNHCTYQDLIGPLAPAGAVFGSILSSPVVAMMGFVTGLVVMSSLLMSGWLLIAVSYFTYHGGAWSPVFFRALLFLGRLLTGVGVGWAAGVVPVYIGEVSPPSIRGKLGALFQMSICTGVLLTFLLGTYISYWQFAFMCTAVSIVELVLMFTIRESPRLSRNPLKNIRALLAKRQSDSTCNNGMALNATTAPPTRKVHQRKSSIKSNCLRIVIVSILMSFQQLVGVNAIASYAGPIFHAAGLDQGGISSGLLASLTIGVVQFVMTILSFFVVDRFGRRIPLFLGGLALMVANIGMAVYFGAAFGFIPSSSGNSTMEYTNSSSIQNCVSVPLEPSPLSSHLSPLPIASVCLFYAAYSLSWGPVPWIIGGEIFPDEIRELGMGISAAIGWVCNIVVITAFPVVSGEVGEAIPFLVLAGCSLLAFIFVALFLAETKDLRLDQISSMEVTNVMKNVKEFGLLLQWLFRCGFVRRITPPHYQD